MFKKKSQKTFKRIVGQFPVIVQEDVAGGYWVTCPILPGCYSQGETIEEALANIREAIVLCVEDAPKTKLKYVHQPVSLHLVNV